MSDRAKNILNDWLKIVASVAGTAVLGWIAHVKAVTALETRQDLGERRLGERVLDVTKQIERLDREGCGPAKVHEVMLRGLTDRMVKAEAQQAETAAAISDMRADIRVIAEWVKEQRGLKTAKQ